MNIWKTGRFHILSSFFKKDSQLKNYQGSFLTSKCLNIIFLQKINKALNANELQIYYSSHLSGLSGEASKVCVHYQQEHFGMFKQNFLQKQKRPKRGWEGFRHYLCFYIHLRVSVKRRLCSGSSIRGDLQSQQDAFKHHTIFCMKIKKVWGCWKESIHWGL